MRPPTTMLRLLVLTWLMFPLAAPARQDNSWIGRRVITRFGTILKVGGQVVDNERLRNTSRGRRSRDFRVYKVRHVNGPWLWLEAETGRRTRLGPGRQCDPVRAGDRYHHQ